MSRGEILAKIKDILGTMRSVDPGRIESLSEGSDFFIDVGLHSAELVNLAAKVEAGFGIEFEDEDIDDLDSKISSTIDLVEKAIANK